MGTAPMLIYGRSSWLQASGESISNRILGKHLSEDRQMGILPFLMLCAILLAVYSPIVIWQMTPTATSGEDLLDEASRSRIIPGLRCFF